MKVYDKKKKKYLNEGGYAVAPNIDNSFPSLSVYPICTSQQGGTEEWESSIDLEDDINQDDNLIIIFSLAEIWASIKSWFIK